MRREQSFYGLQARGIDGVRRPHTSIHEMARAYLSEVRERQPHGPYLLGGYSAGGVVAFEMARLLSSAGEAVSLLALIDTMHPLVPVRNINMLTRLVRLRAEGGRYLVGAVQGRQQRRARARNLEAIERHLARGEAVPFALREDHLVQSYRMAVEAYAWAPWRGRATLFRSARLPFLYEAAGPAYGWGEYVLGGIDIVILPGDHHTILLGRNAEPLGRELDAAIATAAGDPRAQGTNTRQASATRRP
jgi:thioesterase domain-containing protein